MSQGPVTHFESPNIVSLLAEQFSGTPLEHFLHLWENVIFSLISIGMVGFFVFLASRKMSLIPGRLQSCVEIFVEGVRDFFGGTLGAQGKKFIPFVGTLFVYILFMNLMGLVPFLKSPTANLSTTAALAICVFVLFLYTAIKELGVMGFADHLAGKPRGVIARIIILPLFLFVLEFLTVFIRPVTLSLRLRGNIWGEDLMMSILMGFGLPGTPLLLFVTFLAIIASIVQALVFSMLTAVYFALILNHEE